jgi:hypothetical protein
VDRDRLGEHPFVAVSPEHGSSRCVPYRTSIL